MGRQWIIICLLIAYAHISYQMSTPTSESYIAAVVEFPPQHQSDGKLTLKTNTDAYIKHIRTANASDADIIVFPEDGLTTISFPQREKMDDWSTVVPAATDNYIPCDQNTIEVSDVLKRISCAAKQYRIYVVINIAEKLPCTKNTCTKYDKAYYNTNVAFDRNGKIIARYRKTHLFEEPVFNVTKVPEIVTFDTDFGVKFGTFICFDILFDVPGLQLTRTHQITDIVYSTAWFSEIPFLTAVQVQSGWSYAENVNFLVSGYNNPSAGNAGSGIYLGRKGTGKAIMPSFVHEEVLIHEVPKMKKRNESNVSHSKNFDNIPHHVHDESRKKRQSNAATAADGMKLLHDNIHAFDTFLIKGNVTNKTVCQNNFCCDIKVVISETDPTTKYRLVVFNGIRSFGIAVNGSVSVCGIIQCSNQSIESCGSVKKSGTVFKDISIFTTYYNYKEKLIMPSTLGSELCPIPNSDWSYDDRIHDDHVHINMYLTRNRNNILTFGLFARNFTEDSANMAASFSVTYFTVLLMASFLLKL